MRPKKNIRILMMDNKTELEKDAKALEKIDIKIENMYQKKLLTNFLQNR